MKSVTRSNLIIRASVLVVLSICLVFILLCEKILTDIVWYLSIAVNGLSISLASSLAIGKYYNGMILLLFQSLQTVATFLLLIYFNLFMAILFLLIIMVIVVLICRKISIVPRINLICTKVEINIMIKNVKNSKYFEYNFFALSLVMLSFWGLIFGSSSIELIYRICTLCVFAAMTFILYLVKKSKSRELTNKMVSVLVPALIAICKAIILLLFVNIVKIDDMGFGSAMFVMFTMLGIYFTTDRNILIEAVKNKTVN